MGQVQDLVVLILHVMALELQTIVCVYVCMCMRACNFTHGCMFYTEC